jgi:hypothetical protein
MQEIPIPITSIDLASLGGLAFAVPILIGAIKGKAKKYVKGKETLLAYLLTYGLGFLVKFTVPQAYPNIDPVTLIVMFVFVAQAAMQVHDKLWNRIFKVGPQ